MSITITGMDELLQRLSGAQVIQTLEPPMQRSVLRLEAYMKQYPPAPSQSTYRRTGTEGRRWTTRIDRTTNSLTGRVGNNVPYAPFVQSRMFQVAVHRRTGWKTDADAVRDNEAAIVDDFERTVARAVAG